MLRDSRCLLYRGYPQPLPTIHRRDGTLPDTASLVRDTRGNQIAKWFGWAFGALVFTIVHDILYTLEVIANTTFIVPIGFTAFILAQAIIISHKFSSAFKERDENQRKLLDAYQELDEELLKRETLVENEELKRKSSQASSSFRPINWPPWYSGRRRRPRHCESHRPDPLRQRSSE